MTEAESSVGAIPVDDEATENDANVPVDDKSSKRVAKTTKLLEFVARSATFLNAKDGEGTNTWVKNWVSRTDNKNGTGHQLALNQLCSLVQSDKAQLAACGIATAPHSQVRFVFCCSCADWRGVLSPFRAGSKKAAKTRPACAVVQSDHGTCSFVCHGRSGSFCFLLFVCADWRGVLSPLSAGSKKRSKTEATGVLAKVAQARAISLALERNSWMTT